jgi:hypothetical protein
MTDEETGFFDLTTKLRQMLPYQAGKLNSAEEAV